MLPAWGVTCGMGLLKGWCALSQGALGLGNLSRRPWICPDVETHWVRDMGGRCVSHRGQWR